MKNKIGCWDREWNSYYHVRLHDPSTHDSTPAVSPQLGNRKHFLFTRLYMLRINIAQRPGLAAVFSEHACYLSDPGTGCFLLASKTADGIQEGNSAAAVFPPNLFAV
jgi:hypothetical protein